MSLDHPWPPASPAWRRAARVLLLVGAATALCAVFDAYISLTSQAMLYLAAVVIGAYGFDRITAIVTAVAAVTAFNFFFVPPRYTLAVDDRDNLIALAALLGVALLVSWLSTQVRNESRLAAESERRARQLSSLATELLGAADEAAALAAGERALRSAFERVVLVARDTAGQLHPVDGLAPPVVQALRACVNEAAVIGPGTGRWPGIDAWLVPLGSRGHVIGAVRVEPALAADILGREHAMALASVLAQGLWRLRSAEAHQQARDSLQRQRLLGTFLAAVSHDLRTPLAAIVAAASSLHDQRERLPAAEQERMLAGILEQARYLDGITENTLQLVRLGAGPNALRPEWQSLEEIVGSVVRLMRDRPGGGRIETAFDAGLPLVRGDATLLAQLVTNLLDNACRYARGPLQVGVRRVDGKVELDVEDGGPGLSSEAEAHLFEAYFRGEAKPAGHGAGLGLALCRAIAEAHGGTVSYVRCSGGGSRFTLSLPLEAQPGEVVSEAAA